MKYFNRSWISIIRNPWKSIRFLLLVFVLGTFMSVGFSLSNAIFNTEDNLNAKIPNVASVGLFEEAKGDISEYFPSIESITQVASLPQVKGYDIYLMSGLFSRDLQWVKPPLHHDDLPLKYITVDEARGLQMGERERIGEYIELFIVTGTNSSKPIEVESGLISLYEGRFMTEEEIEDGASVVVISRDFAEVNRLNLGQVIAFENIIYDEKEQSKIDFYTPRNLDEYIIDREFMEFKIIGIFDVERDFNYPKDFGIGDTIRIETELYNKIYMPLKKIVEIDEFRFDYTKSFFIEEMGFSEDVTFEETLYYNNLFLIKDIRSMDEFIKDANELLPSPWEMLDLYNVHPEITNSMNTMNWIANMIFWGSLSVTIIILILLINMYARGRKYEIGLLLALGEKRFKIVSQILLEVFISSVIAIPFALLLGNHLASSFSEELLRKDIEHQLAEESEFSTYATTMALSIYHPGKMDADEMMAAYDSSLKGDQIALFVGIGIGVIIVSTTVPILYIFRLQPKEILL